MAEKPLDAREQARQLTTRQRILTLGGTAPNVAVTTGAASTTITLPSAEPDTGYGVVISPSWKTAYSVRGKSTTQFVVDWDVVPPANSTLDWFVFRSERAKTAAVAGGGGGGGGGGGTAVDDASMVQAQHAFRAPQASAPLHAPYVTVSADPLLPYERRLRDGKALTLVDGGPGGDLTASVVMEDGELQLSRSVYAPHPAPGVGFASVLTQQHEPSLPGSFDLQPGVGLQFSWTGTGGPLTIDVQLNMDDFIIIQQVFGA